MAKSPEITAYSDHLEGALHPREQRHIYGHDAAEALFLQAFQANRLHHAWLISGARGIGKATLAWRFARLLLSGDLGESLNSQQLETRVFVLKRGLNAAETALSSDIRIDEVRKMKSIFTLSAPDGGRRVAIIDAADDLNAGAANALLKLLEEPPPDVTFLIIAHQPHRLLPTIRSRCQVMRLMPLGADDFWAALSAAGCAASSQDAPALCALAAGSVGQGVSFWRDDGLALYKDLVDLFSGLPKINRNHALKIVDTAPQRFELILTMIDIFLVRLARFGVVQSLDVEACLGEAALMHQWSGGGGAGQIWADLAQEIGMRARAARAVHLDPAAVVMDSLLQIEARAALIVRN